MKRPLQFSIYKGMKGKWGALQFNLQPPHYYEDSGKGKDFVGDRALDTDGRLKDGWKIREGAIFLEMTSPKGNNVYDWEQKIIMALSVTDMGKLALTLTTGQPCSIIHDPHAKTTTQGTVTKSLKVESRDGPLKGCMVYLSMTTGGKTIKHTVPLSGDEVIVITQLLRTAISRAMNW